MLRKILAITRKELLLTYTDRNVVLFILLTPLAIATIIGLAFSGVMGRGSNDVPVRDIAVAVVNLDEGADTGAAEMNQGQFLVEMLVPPADATEEALVANPLFALTDAVALTDPDEARAQVDNGELAAAIIIPADFSRQLTFTQDRPLGQTAIEVYANAGAVIEGQIIQSIVSGFTSQIVTGSITVASTLQVLLERAQSDPEFGAEFGLVSAAGGFEPDFGPAYDPSTTPIHISQQSVGGEPAQFNPLVLFGSAQALMFMLFTAMASVNGMLEDMRNGTLQRLFVTPTPRFAILVGKLSGAWVTAVVQVVALFVALTLIGSLIMGRIEFIWGSDLLAIAAVILATAFAATGLASVVSAVARTPEQGDMAGTLIAIAFGIFGGAFFSIPDIPIMQALSKLTVNYWGVDAFTRLAQGNAEVGLNVLVLTVGGAVLLAVGVFLFNRRLNNS